MDYIVYTTSAGDVEVVVPAPHIVDMVALEQEVVPIGATNIRHITTADLPVTRAFRNAWDDSNPESYIGVNVIKAKVISHEQRRLKRDKRFAPLDRKATVPDLAVQAEADREVIRVADAALQIEIDAAITEPELRTIVEREQLF